MLVLMFRILFLLILFPSAALAKGISPYLPLKLTPEVESQIEKLMAITPSAPLSKPYKAKSLLNRLELIKDSHPVLYQRLGKYLNRYKKQVLVNHLGIEVGYGNDTEKPIPNQRGETTKSNLRASASAYTFVNPYFYTSVGGFYSEDTDLVLSNTHIGFGYEYAQVEIGFREHWFSPFQDSAMLVSTNAEAAPSITISNTTPITSWDIRYEIFYTELDEVEGIRLGDEVFPGKPRHAGLHFSFSPLDNWTIGLNRTLQFGGGKRSVDFGDFFEALFDPAGKDNVDGSDGTDPNFEFGNQQASITTKWNTHLWTPISLYAELAGEDTQGGSNFSLGNQATSFGIYLPSLTDEISLRYEFSDWTTNWYTHPLYQSGYTNKGQVLGHWGGDARVFNNDTPATTHSLNINWNVADNQLVDVTVRAIRNKERDVFAYENGYEIQALYSYAMPYGFIGVELYGGKDVFGNNFSRLSGFYRW